MADLREQVAKLGPIDGIRPEPRAEPVLDALHVEQRLVGQVFRAAVWELPVAGHRVEQLARPLHDRHETIEMREACRSQVCHRHQLGHASAAIGRPR